MTRSAVVLGVLTVALGLVHADGTTATREQALAPLIAFERTANKQTQIFVMNVDGTEQRRLASGCCAAWSPDGSMIAFLVRVGREIGDVVVINRDGTGMRKIVSRLALVEAGAPWYPLSTPTWSPDGRQIAFSGTYGKAGAAIYVVNADGSGLARLTSPRAKIDDVAPAWSPDGTQIAFERDNFADPRGYPVIVMNADGTSQRTLTPKSIDALTPAWSRDATRITFAAGEDINRLDVFVMNRDGSAQVNVTKTRSPDDEAPQFSPNGRMLVFQSFTNGPGKREVNVIDVAGTRHRNLSRNPAADYDPTWTPDGRVLFVSTRDGNGDIYVMTATGARVTNLTNTPTELGYNRRPRWSPTP